MAPISEKGKIPKESIKTQKVTNTSIFIVRLEPEAPNKILVESKIQSDVSLLSGVTEAGVTPERRIPRRKNRESPAMSPPRKDPIPNQYIDILITQQDPSLPKTI